MRVSLTAGSIFDLSQFFFVFVFIFPFHNVSKTAREERNSPAQRPGGRVEVHHPSVVSFL